jgi:acetyl-CoA carboxylase biotin carboxyl carrier protein
MSERHDESRISPSGPTGAEATGEARATDAALRAGAADAKATGTALSAGAADAKATGAAGGSMSPETASLLGLIDRLGSLLEKSDVVELEVEAGETGIVLRKPAALAPAATGAVASGAETAAGVDGMNAAAAGERNPAPAAKFVKAPLTGIFYSASSPNTPPYVTVGQHIKPGDVIGLIEAMKLFNEIKSDQTGRVVRIVAETGKLVKARQPLIEVEP